MYLFNTTTGNMNTNQSVYSGLTNAQRPEVLQTPLPLEPTSCKQYLLFT